MRIFQSVKEGERVPFLMTRIEEDNAVLVRLVVLFITGKEDIRPHVGEHLADAVNEHVWLVITIVGCHVFLYLVTHKADEVVGVSL